MTKQDSTTGAEKELGWTKEFPKISGFYWVAVCDAIDVIHIDIEDETAWPIGESKNQWDKFRYWPCKFLGPIKPDSYDSLGSQVELD